MMNRRTCLSSAAVLSTLPFAGALLAQNKYPSQPVKIIVALPAGGGVDMLARSLGQKLSANLGQPVIVDNKAGGSGQIGMSQVAKSPADGYTITIAPLSFLATNKSIFKTLSYDPEKDFAPITRLVTQPMVLVVKDKQKYPNAGAFIAAAKANPGGLTYASSGDGSPQHLVGLLFESHTRTKLLHVPYKGGALAINDLLAGTVDSVFAVMTEAMPFIKAGTLLPLGVMGQSRSQLFPQVPTMQEQGVTGLNVELWIAMLAPANTPRPIVDQLNRAVREAFDPELKAKLAETAMDVAPTSPEELRQLISREIKVHGDLLKTAGWVPQ
jgi:tripartite-type tricarboxylate transporter receptor subunit TctC